MASRGDHRVTAATATIAAASALCIPSASLPARQPDRPVPDRLRPGHADGWSERVDLASGVPVWRSSSQRHYGSCDQPHTRSPAGRPYHDFRGYMARGKRTPRLRAAFLLPATVPPAEPRERTLGDADQPNPIGTGISDIAGGQRCEERLRLAVTGRGRETAWKGQASVTGAKMYRRCDYCPNVSGTCAAGRAGSGGRRGTWPYDPS